MARARRLDQYFGSERWGGARSTARGRVIGRKRAYTKGQRPLGETSVPARTHTSIRPTLVTEHNLQVVLLIGDFRFGLLWVAENFATSSGIKLKAAK